MADLQQKVDKPQLRWGLFHLQLTGYIDYTQHTYCDGNDPRFPSLSCQDGIRLIFNKVSETPDF